MSYSLPLNFVVVLSFVIFVFYILGIQNVITNAVENGCEMTHMFEFPQFVEISLPESVHQAHPRYALFGYSEGAHTEKLRQMRFKGIPVLYIPGSSGSHKQGRSLASVSLRKSLNSRTPFHFDYFMVDLNEDQSGLYGGVLEDQTKFVRHCISKILSFYSKGPGDNATSVILIGHSVGGLIAKGVFIDPQFRRESVRMIITLAAPHKRPVIQPDPYIPSFYESVDACWKNSQINHTMLVSIGGGCRDHLVRSDLTYDSTSDINVLTTAVPGVWCSTDHLSIVWCKQFILAIVRAIFDSVDIATKQVTADRELRLSIFKYHLLKRSAGKSYAANRHPRWATFDANAEWIENMLRQFSVIDHKGFNANTYVMIRLHDNPDHELAFIESFNLDIRDWVFVCTADVVRNSARICDNGENLSNATEIAPIATSTRLKRKFVHLDMFRLKALDYTHVIVKIPRMNSFVQLNVDVHSGNEREITVSVPSFYVLSKKTIIQETAEKAIYYKINLRGFESIWQAFGLGVEAVSCNTAKNNAVVSFVLPWASHDSHFYMTGKKSISGRLALTSAKPGNETSSYPYLRMHLEPTCRYRVTMRPSVIAMASQIALYFSGVLPAFVVAVLLLTMRQQASHVANGNCVMFHSALCSAVKCYYIVLEATNIGSKILGMSFFLRLLPPPDVAALEDLNTDFFFVSLVMYAVAIVVTYSLGIACYVSVVMSGKAAHKMALRFIAKTVTGFVNWSEWVFTILHQVPVLVSAMLISLALSTSGALSLCLSTFFYFLKVCNMYEEYLEDVFHYSMKLIAEKVKILTRGRSKESVPEQKSIESRKVNGEAAPQGTGDGDEEGSASSAASSSSSSEAVVRRGDALDSSDESSERSAETSESDDQEIGLLSAMHFHIALLLLWLTTSFFYVPSLLVWAKNYHYSVFLERDPAVVPSIVLNACGAVLWQSGVPHPTSKKLSQIVSATLFILASVSIIYASVSMYRLGYIVSAAVTVVTANQLAAKFSS